MKQMLLVPIHFYSRFLRPITTHFGGCRFVPTCSDYASEVIERYGVVRGIWMALWRILRCHPLSRGGVDLP